MKIEKHEFLDKLKSLHSKLECPFCCCDDWSIYIEKPVDINNQIITNFAIKNLKGNIGVPAVLMCCNNCGFLRMHAVQKLTY